MIQFVETRNALHDLARFVLAAELKGTTEVVTLRRTPGGFGQPERLVNGLQRRIRVDGTDLVVQHGEDELWTPISTLTDASRVASITLSADAPEPSVDLAIDAKHAQQIAEFFALTDSALNAFRRLHATEGPTITQLFPHHFDLAITLSEVNIGGSPGDSEHDEPYLYVAPWTMSPHPTWNESWGASIPWAPSVTVDAALAFFEAGFSDAKV